MKIKSPDNVNSCVKIDKTSILRKTFASAVLTECHEIIVWGHASLIQS